MKLVCVVLLLTFSLHLAALSFEAEELDFSLGKGFWEMDGLFHFVNYSDEAYGGAIFFPIPQDSLALHPQILALELVEGTEASCKMLNQNDNGFSFLLNLPAQYFCTLRIAYRQELKGNSACYIISTANSWDAPLSYARYRLKLQEGISLSKPPFPLQAVDNNVYTWEFTDFRPQTEFRLEFAY